MSEEYRYRISLYVESPEYDWTILEEDYPSLVEALEKYDTITSRAPANWDDLEYEECPYKDIEFIKCTDGEINGGVILIDHGSTSDSEHVSVNMDELEAKIDAKMEEWKGI